MLPVSPPQKKKKKKGKKIEEIYEMNSFGNHKAENTGSIIKR